jgi:hypothetical protein
MTKLFLVHQNREQLQRTKDKVDNLESRHSFKKNVKKIFVARDVICQTSTNVDLCTMLTDIYSLVASKTTSHPL